jgi:soluble lytic murein transglycosylase-like protein
MAHPLRHTTFTWDPVRESRAEVWTRIKIHVQQELNRLEAEQRVARRLVRHQASPQYARNQQIVAAARQGVRDRELARQYGLPPQRVREIIRIEAAWDARLAPAQLSGQDAHPAQRGAHRDRDDTPGGFPGP